MFNFLLINKKKGVVWLLKLYRINIIINLLLNKYKIYNSFNIITTIH